MALEENIRIAVVGRANVGKTCLIRKFVHDEVIKTYEPTEYDIYYHEITLRHSKFAITIGDAGGAPENDANTDENIKESHGFIIVYDLTKSDTFYAIPEIRSRLINLKKITKNLPLVIVGAKSDLNSQRDVLSSQGVNLGRQISCTFFETSIMTGENIKEAFTKIVWEIQEKRKHPVEENGRGDRCCNLL